MSTADRTKTALDESRMLMLGAQILLGFQLQAPFQDAFSTLSRPEKEASLVVLGLITLVIGLLIAPSAHHRIIFDGEASLQLTRFVTRISMVTLPLFAIAVGLDLGIAGARIAGAEVGMAAALLGAVLPLALWFGPAITGRSKEDGPMPTSDEKTALDAKIDYVLTEARVVLPGAQALLGFQLAIVLTNGFAQLPSDTKMVHGLALALIAVATALLIAPAAYHRRIYDGRSEPQFHRSASRMLLLATAFLALGLGVDSYVVAVKITERAAAAIGIAIATTVCLLGLWQLWPWWRAARRERWPERKSVPNDIGGRTLEK